MSVGSTLYAALLRSHELERQRKLEQQRYDDQRYDKSIEQLHASHQRSEDAKNAEFDRKLKVAELMGKTAGATGQGAPTFSNPAVQEWGSAAYGAGASQRQLGAEQLANTRQTSAENELLRMDNDPYNAPTEQVSEAAVDIYNRRIPGMNLQAPLVERMTPVRGGSGGGAPQLNLATKLTAQLQRNPLWKSGQEVKIAYNRLQTAPDNRAGDLAVAYGYAKIMDPNTGVKEGERADLDNAASWDERTRVLYNMVLDGKRLPPQIRQELIQSGGTVYASYRGQYNRLLRHYTKLAESNNLDPALVLGDYGMTEDASPPGGSFGGASRDRNQDAQLLEEILGGR